MANTRDSKHFAFFHVHVISVLRDKKSRTTCVQRLIRCLHFVVVSSQQNENCGKMIVYQQYTAIFKYDLSVLKKVTFSN